MSGLIEYKIFCLSEGQVVRGYTPGLLLPVCPHNHNHAVIASTLIKIAEIPEDLLGQDIYCQTTASQMIIPGATGMTGVTFFFPEVSATLKNFSYQGATGLVGDIIDGYIYDPIGPTAIDHYLHLPLSTQGASVPLDEYIPEGGANDLVYTNNNGLPKVFNFSTTYCY